MLDDVTEAYGDRHPLLHATLGLVHRLALAEEVAHRCAERPSRSGTPDAPEDLVLALLGALALQRRLHAHLPSSEPAAQDPDSSAPPDLTLR
ncbi:MAG: hypothetical protein H6732_13285 [Alphaproteobacteria bacterium]|nr:hypothetical protein [Alphaproteobacteria bacterium]